MMIEGISETVLWFAEHQLQEISAIVNENSTEFKTKILITGSEGMAMNELVDYLISAKSHTGNISERLDFLYQDFRANHFIADFLGFHFRNHTPVFQSFLSKYPTRHKAYIRDQLRILPHSHPHARNEWLMELYVEFLSDICRTNRFFLIFENIDQVDRLSLNRLIEFLKIIEHLSIRLLFTQNPEGNFYHELDAEYEIVLSKLSIQTVAKYIQKHLKTSAINARLIANHCYIKTGGVPVKVRILLNSIFKNSVIKAEKDTLDLAQLRKIKIPNQWEGIIQLFLSKESAKGRKILIFLAHLFSPIQRIDLELLLSKLSLKTECMSVWLNSGLLKEIKSGLDRSYVINISFFRNWLVENYPLTEIKDVLFLSHRLQCGKELIRTYPLSELLYDAGFIDKAAELAELEAEAYCKEGHLTKAVDRFSFLIRLSELDSLPVPESDKYFEKLKEAYLVLGSYENAYQLLKKQVSSLDSKDWMEDNRRRKRWLNLNLQMARCLISMDAYHEARYVIRETKVKTFCDDFSAGRCHEFLGDIEINLAHHQNAIRNYREALRYYQKTTQRQAVLQFVFKMKKIMAPDLKLFEQLIDNHIKFPIEDENLTPLHLQLWREKIQLLMKREQHLEALQKCFELRRMARRIYEPALSYQLAFYLAEIYVLVGKWRLALSHLKRARTYFYIQHRPLLQVQLLIQLALIYKEQSYYGEARRLLENGMDICFESGFTKQLNEIKLHLGHIYLLVHSLIRASEYLREVHDWSAKYQYSEICLLTKLYLSYYHLRNGNLEKSRRLLSEAKKLVNLSLNPLDLLNYLFYLGMWLVKNRRYQNAVLVAQLMLTASQHSPRYQAISYYLLCLVHSGKGSYEEARIAAKRSLKIIEKWHYPHLKYLLLCENVRLSRQQMNERDLKAILQETCGYLKILTEKFNDTILENQFLEAQFHEDIIHLCKSYQLM